MATDGLRSYNALTGVDFSHIPAVAPGAVAATHLPFAHVMFSNHKALLNGTHHGVSKKHLHRHPREWNYRFNRRNGPVADFVLSRLANQPMVTYSSIIAYWGTSIATGKIKAVRSEGNDILVDAKIIASGFGTMPIAVKVHGPILDAPEQACETTRSFEADLAKSFDAPRILM